MTNNKNLIIIKNIELELLKRNWSYSIWCKNIGKSNSDITRFMERLKANKKISKKTMETYLNVLEIKF